MHLETISKNVCSIGTVVQVESSFGSNHAYLTGACQSFGGTLKTLLMSNASSTMSRRLLFQAGAAAPQNPQNVSAHTENSYLFSNS